MANEKMPWEMDLGVATNVVTSAPSENVQEPTVAATLNPWEMDLGAARIPVKIPKATPPKQSNATPSEWNQINQQYAAGQGQRNQDQLFTLQAELAKEKDPKNIASLKREISRLQNG